MSQITLLLVKYLERIPRLNLDMKAKNIVKSQEMFRGTGRMTGMKEQKWSSAMERFND